MASADAADSARHLTGDNEQEVGRSPGDVARELGVSVVTLRSWERRYGVGPAHRQPGRHRRYLAVDVALLKHMCDLIGGGLPPAQAAEIARHAGNELTYDPTSTGPSPGTPSTSQVGHVDVARGLFRTAMRMDDLGCRRLLRRAIARRRVTAAWDEVMMPALRMIGERYAATGRCVEVEHLLSSTISAALGAVPRPSPDAVRSDIVLACADDEQHSLALEALAAALAERGIGVRLLGARTPPDALLAALRSTRATTAMIWSQLETTGDVTQLERIRTARFAPPILAAAGPGWSTNDLPTGVRRPSNLPQAVDLLQRYAHSPAPPRRLLDLGNG